MNQTPTARTENLAYALDSWNNNILIQDKLPPRNKSGLKSYTKDFGKTAREFNLIDVTFVDAINAYRSLPFSLPEFKIFEIPSKLKPYIEMIDQKTSAIATILDYQLKDGKPKEIYDKSDPHTKQAELLLSHREVALELFPKVNRLNHLFPSVAVLWGCLLIGEIRFTLFDSGFSEAMIGDLIPNDGFSKRKISNQATDSLDYLKGKITNQKKAPIPIGLEPYIIFWGDIKGRENRKKQANKSRAIEELYRKISALNKAIKNDPKSDFYWIDQGLLFSTQRKSERSFL